MDRDIGPDSKLFMKPFVQITPLQAARPGVDDEQYIKDVEQTGGRPGYDHEIAGMYISDSPLLLSLGGSPCTTCLGPTTNFGASSTCRSQGTGLLTSQLL